MRAWVAGCFVPLFAFAPAPAASAAEPAMVWRCVQEFDENFHVRCVPASQAPDGADPAPATPARGPAIDMRPVAQRGHAEVFSTDAWLVPLHTRPSDTAMVEQLLQSVLCGKHPACRVDYGATAARVARR